MNSKWIIQSFSDVQYSCFLCCTKFLFSMLYKIPAFNDVQYSCMRCCTLVCFALICCIKVWMYIILVGVLYLILMYTSIATPVVPPTRARLRSASRPSSPSASAHLSLPPPAKAQPGTAALGTESLALKPARQASAASPPFPQALQP